MATARPIIVARIGAVAESGMMPLSALIEVRAIDTLMIAVTRGRPARRREPKVTSRTR